jgi:eukaryotic-like serine/threonine-protein kinase
MNLHTTNNRASLVGAVLTLLGSLPACAGAPPPGHAGGPEATTAPPSELRLPAAVESAPAASAASAAPTTEAPARERAGACPAGMADIPGGTFLMGHKDAGDQALPAHRVTLDGFCLDVTPVTVGAYARCSTCAAPSTFHDCNEAGKGKDDHPRNCVSWDAATAYCRSQDKALPTEAQWEYASSGGAEQRRWSLGGSNPTSSTACLDRASRQGVPEKGTCPVGAYVAGAFGLMDMVGNVWEWVADWYGPYRPGAQKNPPGPSSGELRSMRGGAWDIYPGSDMYTALRGSFPPDTRMGIVGFRCAKAR